jgi:hypothetical protein
MFNIFIHQENANQNYIETPSHPSHSGHHQKKEQKTKKHAAKDRSEVEPTHCWWECKKSRYYGNHCGGLKKLKIELSYDLAV